MVAQAVVREVSTLENGLAPALSENWTFEAATKTDVLKQRLSVSGAGFRIHRTDVPEADPLGFYRQIGEGTSHGLGLEAVESPPG